MSFSVPKVLGAGFLMALACSASPDMPPIVVVPPAAGGNGSTWITNGDRSSLLAPGPTLNFKAATSAASEIVVDTTTTYQTMDGFGYTLTGGSAQLLHTKLNGTDRSALLKELFSAGPSAAGISYLRVSIGASDLDDHVFSYDDLAAGETDVTLSKFSLAEDKVHLIPVLKEILAINPAIKILGSPWSSPTWMKTNGLAKGGALKTEYYSAYAQYFVKYVQGMAAEGIPIDAVTIQNEPENPGNTPSLVMTSAEQATFIKSHLGPAFESAGIKTRIILFDHNCDHPNYPVSILNDADAKKYTDGTAFHMYLGDISALSTVHNAHPDKNVYFTEQWTSGQGDFGGDLRWHVKNLIIGAPRNWSRNVLEWNLAADENFNPHTNDGGCNLCQGALTIHSTSGLVFKNVSYYIIAHASRFVPAGSVRIGSNVIDNFHNVAFKTPQGKKVLIVLNDNSTAKSFSIRFGNLSAAGYLQSGSVGTYVW